MALKLVWYLSIVLVSLPSVFTLTCQNVVCADYRCTLIDTENCPYNKCVESHRTTKEGTVMLLRTCGSEYGCSKEFCNFYLTEKEDRSCSNQCCETELCNAGPLPQGPPGFAEYGQLGWGDTLYRFSYSGENWTSNRAKCQGEGGDLVSMETDYEWKLISDNIRKLTIDEPQEWHIGLKKVGDDWKWVSGERLTYSKWQEGEPSGDGDVTVMSKNYPSGTSGLFNDLSDTKERAYICELPMQVFKDKKNKELKDFKKLGDKFQRSHSKKER